MVLSNTEAENAMMPKVSHKASVTVSSPIKVPFPEECKIRVIYLLGVNANLCLHNSQYSFLLCFSHCTKLGKHRKGTEHRVRVHIWNKADASCLSLLADGTAGILYGLLSLLPLKSDHKLHQCVWLSTSAESDKSTPKAYNAQ